MTQPVSMPSFIQRILSAKSDSSARKRRRRTPDDTEVSSTNSSFSKGNDLARGITEHDRNQVGSNTIVYRERLINEFLASADSCRASHRGNGHGQATKRRQEKSGGVARLSTIEEKEEQSRADLAARSNKIEDFDIVAVDLQLPDTSAPRYGDECDHEIVGQGLGMVAK